LTADPGTGNSKTTLVVFVGLLLDLLAFTLILPLFPALLDHYKKHDSATGLYPYLVSIFFLYFFILAITTMYVIYF
jgi:hypothetical protein